MTNKTETAPTGLGRQVFLAFFWLVVIGGSNAVAVRITTFELDPIWASILRFVPSVIIFWGLLLARRVPLPRGRALYGALIYGLLSVGVFYGLVYFGLDEVPAGMASILLALGPLMTFFFAVLMGQETFRWLGVLGGLISLGGVYLAVGANFSQSAPAINLLAVAGAALTLAYANVMYKSFPQNHPLVTNTLILSSGVVVLVLVSLISGETWNLPQEARTWWVLGYAILGGTVLLFYLFFYVLDRWSAYGTSYLFLLMPIVTVLLSAWIEGEAITPSFVLGGALVLLGVWVGAFLKGPKAN